MEVVVVLNGEANPAFACEMQKHPVRVLVEPRRGVCFARNTALPHLNGEIAAFLDDDVEVRSGWVHEIAKGFGDARVACVTGRVVPAGLSYLDSERLARFYSSPRVTSEWMLEASDRDWIWQVLGERAGAGCNMAFRHSFLTEHTSFPEDLGAGSLIGGADEDYMFLRVLRAGYALHHVPEAVVTHHFDGDPSGTRNRSAQLYAASVAFMLKLIWEERGIRFRLLKAIGSSAGRKLRRLRTRIASPGEPQEALSYVEKLLALFRGLWIFVRSRGRTNSRPQSSTR